MKRVAAAAIVGILVAGGVVAQVTPPAPDVGPVRQPVDFAVVQGAEEYRLGDIRGRVVTNPEGETLGAINDLVIDEDGQITAVLINVGGFLGIGVKTVAISFDAITGRGEPDDRIWIANATREALATAPAFRRLNDAPPADAATAPFVAAQQPGEVFVDGILGRPVRNLEGEALGTIGDILFAPGGRVSIVVLGVGGFLGIGEKPIGVPFAALTPIDSEGGRAFVLDVNREALEQAPVFQTALQADGAAVAAPANDDAGAPTNGPAFGFADLAAAVSPAVVSIRVEVGPTIVTEGQVLPFAAPDQRPRIGLGSGFFISADGYLVTNNHVVSESQDIVVALEGGEVYSARVVGTDPRTDLALLKVDADRIFPFVRFAEEPARIGDWALVVGNPYGLGGTVTLGIVSALGRDIGAGPYDDFMQIDAAINAGNSGGPAFNLAGEVIGVNSAIFSPTGASVGIGFAIPAYIVADVVADLQDDGVVERGWLGVQVQRVNPDIAAALGLPEPRGALIANIVEETPAAGAGLRPTDVITAVEGEAIADERELARTIATYDPGEQVTLTVWRDGAETTLEVTLDQLPGDAAPPPPPAEPAAPPAEEAVQGIGLMVTSANAAGAGPTGLLVVAIDPNGLAAGTPLRPGDIIVEADGQPVATPNDLVRILAEAQEAGDAAILLRIVSGDADGFVGLRLRP